MLSIVGQCCKNYQTNGFDYVEDLAEFKEDFIKSYNGKSMKNLS